jgi:hypothetical protein
LVETKAAIENHHLAIEIYFYVFTLDASMRPHATMRSCKQLPRTYEAVEEVDVLALIAA